MTQPPSNDYPASGSPYDQPADPYATPAQSYDAPVDPYATPVDPYATPVDPYATPAESYAAPVGGDANSTKETAKNEAANVKDTAVGAGQQVASVAKDEAKNVAAETASQAKDVAKQVAGEASSQLSQGKQQLATLVHSAAKQLGSMASSSDESGPLTNLAQRASQQVGEVGHWLENREPRELVSDLTDFARRRPAVFLVGAALAGAVAGRLTRGLVADAKDNASSTTGYASSTGYAQSTAPTYVADEPVQGGRYGDLASEQQVVGYGVDGPSGVSGYQGDVVR